MLKEGFSALQRNYKPLLMYLAVTVSYFTLKLAVEYFLKDQLDAEAAENFARWYFFGSGVLTAGVYAFAQSAAFSLLGEELDRPFWKIHGVWEGVKRFFGLWMLLDLLNLTSLIFVSVLPADEASLGMLQFLWLGGSSCIVPFGATVMFYGKVGKEEITEAFTTISRQIPSYFIMVMVTLGTASLVLSIEAIGIPIWIKPALPIVDGYVDCLIFACVWHVCRIQRETQDDIDDFDF